MLGSDWMEISRLTDNLKIVCFNCPQPRQSFYEEDRRLPPPPPRDNYSNQGPPSQVSVYSNQSNNDNQGGRWGRVWIPN